MVVKKEFGMNVSEHILKSKEEEIQMLLGVIRTLNKSKKGVDVGKIEQRLFGKENVIIN